MTEALFNLLALLFVLLGCLTVLAWVADVLVPFVLEYCKHRRLVKHDRNRELP